MSEPKTGKVDVTGRPVEPRRTDLQTFFRPKTVAVIGASDTPLRPNTAMFEKIKKWAEHFGATVHPVNPGRETIGETVCYPSILDVPGDIDLACILVGDAVEVLPQVIEKKAKFAVVFAAGFSEVGEEGEAKQAELDRLITESDLHVLGPNTNLNAFEIFREDLEGKALALITQSGHQGRPIFQAQELGVRLAYWAPTGNEVDLEFADFTGFFADQPEVGAIAAYIEGFKDGRTLMLAADHAAQQGVPITIVKVGRTDEGQSMAKAHTGHLTGSDAVTSAVFRQFGVNRVDGLDELQETAAMFARTVPPQDPSRRAVAVYSISGGTGAHMADMASMYGLNLPKLTDATQKALHEHIPPYLRVSNPIDCGGPPAGDKRGRPILDSIMADPNIDLLICPITGALAHMSNRLAKDLINVAEESDKPVFVIWGSPLGDEVAYKEILLKSSKVVVFRTFGNAVRAARAYFDYHEFRQGYSSPFAKPVLKASSAAKAARELVVPGTSLSEHRSKQLLSAYGIPVTNDALCTSAKEAVAAADGNGYPVVLKVSSPDLLHKSDAGLVKVGLGSAKEVRAAYSELLEKAEAADPDATIEGVLVSEMVRGGVETVVGVAHDELFGPVVMFGLGGVFVEVLKDVTFRVPPFDKDEARRMIEELKGAAMLRGVRGAKASDTKALVDVLVKVQRLALDLSDDIAELDINPLVVLPKGAKALDALVVCK